ncbi:Type I restriction modification DNA specificity domain protein [anaerobic digester metagenome]
MIVKDLFKISKGRKAEESLNSSFDRYIQIEDLRSSNEMKYASPDSRNVMCNEKDILIAWDGANAGTIGYSLSGVIGSTIAKLTPVNARIYSPYGGRYLQSKFDYLRSNCTGATIPHISRAILESIEIPLPPLDQQKKIAAILDAADTYRQKTKTLIAKYDELAQSLFLEMFGDPVRNEKGWSKKPILQLGKVITGSTPPSAKANMFGGEIPFITPGDLESSSAPTRYLTQAGAENSRTVPCQSLFVCCIGATIGKRGIALTESAFNQQINAIVWSEHINYLYGFHSFNWLKQEVKSRAISTTLPILKKSEFEKIEMPVAPIELQLKFAERVQSMESQKALAQRSLEKAEELFNSLLQRAFKGELI